MVSGYVNINSDGKTYDDIANEIRHMVNQNKIGHRGIIRIILGFSGMVYGFPMKTYRSVIGKSGDERIEHHELVDFLKLEISKLVGGKRDMKQGEVFTSQKKIEMVCDGMKKLLLEKNKRYGDSALTPINVFSKLPAGAGILQRLDDKLKRIQNGPEQPRKNDVADLIGYLVLYCGSVDYLTFDELID